MEKKTIIRIEDLVNNPTARVPVCLCLDTSASMAGEAITELNKGIKLFYDAIRKDETAYYSAEISIVTFGSKAKCVADFSSLGVQPTPPKLKASGKTPMGEAVKLALKMLERRKKEYQERGVDYYQPWLVLMSDGGPNGDKDVLIKSIKRTAQLVKDNKLTVFPIGIGPDANMKILGYFSPKREPLRLQGLKFSEFFSWLSKSVSKTSQSTPGEHVKLDIEGIKGWGEL